MTTSAPSYSGPGRPGPRAPREGGRPRFIPRRKVCAFCVDHTKFIDYKSVERFGRYISDRGRIEPRRKTGTCAFHQRMLANAIKRARHVALLPFTQDHIRLTGVMASRPPMRAPYHRPGPPTEAPAPPPATAPEGLPAEADADGNPPATAEALVPAEAQDTPEPQASAEAPAVASAEEVTETPA